MNAGLPGTGIGGLFYIASALWMPAHRVLTGRTHEGTDWRRVAGQVGIAGGVLVALFLTGWLLGLMLAAEPGRVAGGAAAVRVQNVVRWVAVLGTAGLLIGVLLAVEALHLVLRPQRAATEPVPPREWPPRPRRRMLGDAA